MNDKRALTESNVQRDLDFVGKTRDAIDRADPEALQQRLDEYCEQFLARQREGKQTGALGLDLTYRRLRGELDRLGRDRHDGKYRMAMRRICSRRAATTKSACSIRLIQLRIDEQRKITSRLASTALAAG